MSRRPYLVAGKTVEPRALPDHFDARADEFAYLMGVVEFPHPATIGPEDHSSCRPLNDAG